MSVAALSSPQPPRARIARREASQFWPLAAYLALALVVGVYWLQQQLAAQLAPHQTLAWQDFVLPLWTIVIGVVTNASCALLGCYLVLRRMSLLGDAISHGVLPGIALAFIFSGSVSGLPILLGAMALGVLTSILTQSIAQLGKVSEDTSMGVVFTSLFALGVVLIQGFARRAHIDPACVLYGQIDYAAVERPLLLGWEVPETLRLLVPALVLTLVFIGLLWKELKIVAFDPALAAAMGIRVLLVHYALVAMVAGVSVAAFWSVGSLVVVAMLIVPAATAFLLTDRLGWMLAWAVTIGTVSAIFGYVLAAQLATNVAGMMAVMAGVQLTGAVFFAPRHGLVSRWLRNQSLAVRIASEDVIGRLYRAEERGQGSGVRGQESGARSQRSGVKDQGETQLPLPLGEGRGEGAGISLLTGWLTRFRLAREGWVARDLTGAPRLTDAGRHAARSLIRAHRLWESYLDTHFDLPRDHLHEAAERMEHFLDPQLQAELDAELAGRAVDPHGKVIPPREDLEARGA